MFKKWCFGLLTTVLALLVIVQQHAIVSNQEIVLEFVNMEIDSPEAQKALTLVKKQLRDLGIKKIQITSGFNNGKLKIAYYSDADIANIKNTLSSSQSETLDIQFKNKNTSDAPLSKDDKEDKQDYKLNIYEIQKSADFGPEYIVNHVLKVKKSQEKETKYNTYSFSAVKTGNEIVNYSGVSLQPISTNFVISSSTSHIFPEVRAGPLS